MVDYTIRTVNFRVEHWVEPNAVLRSVCKTLSSFYILQAGERAHIAPLIDFLTGEVENQYAWFCDLGLVHSRFPGQPYHLLIVKGDKKRKALYGYFEIFGEKGFISLMNGCYQGEDLQFAYTYDPLKHLQIEGDYDFEVDIGKLVQHIHSKPQL